MRRILAAGAQAAQQQTSAGADESKAGAKAGAAGGEAGAKPLYERLMSDATRAYNAASEAAKSASSGTPRPADGPIG